VHTRHVPLCNTVTDNVTTYTLHDVVQGDIIQSRHNYRRNVYPPIIEAPPSDMATVYTTLVKVTPYHKNHKIVKIGICLLEGSLQCCLHYSIFIFHYNFQLTHKFATFGEHFHDFITVLSQFPVKITNFQILLSQHSCHIQTSGKHDITELFILVNMWKHYTNSEFLKIEEKGVKGGRDEGQKIHLKIIYMDEYI